MGAQIFIAVLNDDECHTEHDQRRRHAPWIIKEGIKNIIKSQADHRRRNTRHDNFKPENKYIFSDKRFIAVFQFKRKYFIPEKEHHRQNRSKLYHDKKHFPERLRYIQLHKLIEQNHMPRTADRQPFRNSFHNAEQNSL